MIASYTATGLEQPSLSTGQLIQVKKKSSSGWWEGELQVGGHSDSIVHCHGVGAAVPQSRSAHTSQKEEFQWLVGGRTTGRWPQ